MGLRKMKKYFPVSIATALLIIISGLFFGFPGRYLTIEISPILTAYFGIIYIFVMVNYFFAGATDPGTYPKRSEPEDDEDELRAPVYITVLIHDISVRMKWCSTCNFYRPPRVSHCSVCNSCIDKFDHHCPWVNNCIGRRNYHYFFWFLLLLSIHMVNVFAFGLWTVILNQNRENDQTIFVVSIVVMVIDGLLFIPVFGLFCFHISLVVRGRTTNEQVTGKFRSGVNPFDNGCRGNCFTTLCAPQRPKFIKRDDKVDYTKYTIKPPYTVDRDNLSVRDITIHENGKNPIPINGRENLGQNDDFETQQKQGNRSDSVSDVASELPDVKVVGITSNGSKRQELDPDRFRAKVTPVHDTQSKCQAADAIAYACMDPQLNTDNISDNGQDFDVKNNENSQDGNGTQSSQLPFKPTDSFHQNETKRQNSIGEYDESAEITLYNESAQFQKYQTDEVLYDNFVLPKRKNSQQNFQENHPLPRQRSESQPSLNSVKDDTNGSAYISHESPPDGRITSPLSNTNNCNNIDHTSSLGDVCESGYVSTVNSTEQRLASKDMDLSNKIELENAMRDIEANVALLQESSEGSKKEDIVTSQKAHKENGHAELRHNTASQRNENNASKIGRNKRPLSGSRRPPRERTRSKYERLSVTGGHVSSLVGRFEQNDEMSRVEVQKSKFKNREQVKVERSRFKLDNNSENDVVQSNKHENARLLAN